MARPRPDGSGPARWPCLARVVFPTRPGSPGRPGAHWPTMDAPVFPAADGVWRSLSDAHAVPARSSPLSCPGMAPSTKGDGIENDMRMNVNALCLVGGNDWLHSGSPAGAGNRRPRHGPGPASLAGSGDLMMVVALRFRPPCPSAVWCPSCRRKRLPVAQLTAVSKQVNVLLLSPVPGIRWRLQGGLFRSWGYSSTHLSRRL